MSAERTYRLWRQAGLQVPRRRPRRRVATRRLRPQPPTARNHVWAYDFVFDTCADRRSLTGIVRLIRLDPKNLQSRTIRLQVDATRPGRRLGLV